jgi:predicted TIM-barrel fold metal-dependent hydrolase
MKNPFGSGKAPKPESLAHPLMQAHLQMDLPFVVATDHAIWGTFPEFHLATHLADQVAQVEPYGERITVLLHGKIVYAIPGQAPTSVAARR